MDPTPLIPLPSGTADFLTAIWGDGPHSICWFDASGFHFDIVTHPGHILEKLSQLQTVDVWVGAHPLKARPLRGRGDRDDVAQVVAIPADLDWQHPTRRTDDPLPTEAEVRDGLAKLGHDVQPNLVVHSGHGLQPYWVLAHPVEPDEAEALIDQLNTALARVGLTNGRSDLPSILRLPGTNNHKGGDSVPVTVERYLPDHRYTAAWLRKHLPQATGSGRKGGGTKHHTGSVTHDQQLLVNHIVTVYHGHSPAVWRDGSVHIVRPGKPADGTSSLSVIVGEDGDAIATNFSDHWPGLQKDQSYMLGPDGQLHHPSDPLAQVTINVNQQTPAVIDVYQPDAADIYINWQEFAKRDTVAHQWLVEDFWPLGRAMALWANAKEGKSELALWCVGNLAMGIHPWTGDPVPPIDIAYFDFEMTDDDLDERLSDFGWDLDRLDRLHYALLPPIYPLNTEDGGKQLLSYIESVNAKAVVLDTFARVVTGDENDARTVDDFYRHTGIRLKQQRIGYLRLDHGGHDKSKGHPRGTSAKLGDVDVIWRQRRHPSGNVQLTCGNASRLAWVGPELNVDRNVNVVTGEVSYSMPIRFGWPAGTAEKAADLTTAGVPLDAGRPAAIAALKAAGLKPGRWAVLSAALKFRREQSGTVAGPTPNPPVPPSDQGNSGTGPVDLYSDQPKQ